MKEKSIKILLTTLLICTAVVITGCQSKPGLPLHNGQLQEVVYVETVGERERAQTLVDAKQEYFQALAALSHFYTSKGMELKRIWADREQKNLAESVLFTFDGVKDPLIKPSPSLTKTDEATLVELALSARQKFKDAVSELTLFYAGSNQPWKLAMVESIRQRYDVVRTYSYFMDAEVPPADLKGDQVIADAEQMYADAIALHEKGWFWLFPTNENDQRQALMMFNELIGKYPSSRRIPESAYYIALIYSKVFDENYRAMAWYDRAVRWNPDITLPALYNAALIADKKLSNYRLALDLYTKVVEKSTVRRHVDYAKQRIAELNPAEASGE